MFIYRKAADRHYSFDDLTEEEKHLAQIYIAKHRNGPTGKVDLYFDSETTSFKNTTKHDYGEPPPEF
jgi:replicative DNA helicase